MDAFASKYFRVSRGFVYHYRVSSDFDGSRPPLPALFLLHGFRDFATCWKFLVPHLSSLPCRILAPDLLGHGGTSKPTDPNSYAYHLMVQDLMEIADAEDIKSVIPLGHDHGSVLAQRVYNYVPERTVALIMLNVAYNPPSKAPFNLFTINNMFRQAFGYGCMEYFHFLTSPDAAKLMNDNLDRVWEIPHASSFSEMRDLYGSPDAMREYLANPATPRVDLKPYAKDLRLEAEWKSQIAKGGLEAPLCWYTAIVQQVQHESDKRISEDCHEVLVPVLFVGCSEDAPCRAELIKTSIEGGLLPDITTHVLEGVGHWPMYEEPGKTASFILQFLKSKLEWK